MWTDPLILWRTGLCSRLVRHASLCVISHHASWYAAVAYTVE
ncbi:hypothetical protein BIFGAL_02765 [Bifidobacterium gallicum DSM 20093 = LMG 11596]|uniref:Uncharacterized protein n=1 Tax=Bifidobacterium gallicum DSM 20093 = LMG 11596 TaxID=561180 RepID=D1NSK8_9BIFI|nr:hypothetical protein BIFGAL_02765 [Bifidobacterium gallicum DSM 20093 = LMG 11596]